MKGFFKSTILLNIADTYYDGVVNVVDCDTKVFYGTKHVLALTQSFARAYYKRHYEEAQLSELEF